MLIIRSNVYRQRGISIVELMVGITVGLLVVTAAVAAFVGNLRGSSETLKQIRLGEELNAAMAFVENDIRRAGYWGTTRKEAANPFTAAATDISISGECILYAYDAVYSAGTNFGLADEADFFGFKRVVDNGVGVLQMRNGDDTLNNSDCATGTWVPITDRNVVNITALSFSYEGSYCLDTTIPPSVTAPFINPLQSASGDTTAPCPVVATGAVATDFAAVKHLLTESRVIVISITGQHAADPNVRKTMRTTVSVRNDRIVQL